MSTTINSKRILDKPEWRVTSPPIFSYPSGSTTLQLPNFATSAHDMRANNYGTPVVWYPFVDGTSNRIGWYNAVTDAWSTAWSPSGQWTSAGGGGNGIVAAVAPSQGPKGALLSGNTTTVLNLDTLSYAPAAATWTRTGAVATITTSRPHGFATGQRFVVSATSDATAIPLTSVSNTTYSTITVTSVTSYTITCNNAGALSGTVSIGVPFLRNTLSDRGDGLGYMIRVIGLVSGKIEERRIIANTGSPINSSTFDTTGSVTLDQPLSFTPSTGDRFEILSGKLFTGATGAATAGQWKSYDVISITNGEAWQISQSGNLAVTNLNISSTAQNGLIVLDEQHVPSNNIPGEGFIVGTATYDTATLSGTNYINVKRCLQATAATGNTITGQASGGDSFLDTNQYRNFQIRIVEDTVNTTAVGQRRRISSHTAGPSAVYTLSANWTVTPSSSAKFVIENWTDNIMFFHHNTATMYNYKCSNLCEDTVQTVDTWSNTLWTNTSMSAPQGGIAFQLFGYNINATNRDTFRHSHIQVFQQYLQFVFDIAGGTNGAWRSGRNSMLIQNGISFSLQLWYAYNPFTEDGEYVYALGGITSNAGGSSTNVYKYNAVSGDIRAYTPLKVMMGYATSTGTVTSSTPNAANKMGILCFQDGQTRIPAIYTPRYGGSVSTGQSDFYELLITI